MASFRFDAVDRYGESVGGVHEAADLATARAQLEGRGWKVVDLELVPDSNQAQEVDQPAEPNGPPLRVPREAPPGPLSAGQMTELLDQLGVLTRAGVPLPSGLRAAATEMESTALPRCLRAPGRPDRGRDWPGSSAGRRVDPLPRAAPGAGRRGGSERDHLPRSWRNWSGAPTWGTNSAAGPS